MPSTMTAALREFCDGHSQSAWGSLPFFDGKAATVANAVDARVSGGATVLPPFVDVFAALRLTPPDRVRVVVIGQDPYPTPGDAHGLAFSYKGGRRIPASLKVILAEALGSVPPAGSGDLTGWAEQGVLLLNMALTVEAGLAGAHLKLGWDELARQVVAAISEKGAPSVFMLWGGKAREMGSLVDTNRHLVLECGHPSPLNRYRDFSGCGHFDKANQWLLERGRGEIDWGSALRGAAPAMPPQSSFAFA